MVFEVRVDNLYLLLPLLFPLILCVLQHLLLPQIEEVGGISVELKCLLVIIPALTSKRHYRHLYEVEVMLCVCFGRDKDKAFRFSVFLWEDPVRSKTCEAVWR